MNENLSAAQVAEIRARAEKATPEPWLVSAECPEIVVAEDSVYGVQVADFGKPAGDEYQPPEGEAEGNAAFTACARTDVPALCDSYDAQARRIAELERPAVKVHIGDSALSRDLVWCECHRGLSLHGTWLYCPRCGGKIDQESYKSAVDHAHKNGITHYYRDPEDIELMMAQAAEIKRLKNAIWPGLPKFIPTEAKPQQDFHEAFIESWRTQHDLDQAEIERLKADASTVAHLRSVVAQINEGKAAGAHMSDAEVAGRVRMLKRLDVDHGMVCVMGRDRIIALSDENARLKAKLADAERDSARLDWLERHPTPFDITTLRESECSGDFKYIENFRGWYRGKTIRAAIDAAMQPAAQAKPEDSSELCSDCPPAHLTVRTRCDACPRKPEQAKEQVTCDHGKGPTDYCAPCGRIHSA